MGRTRTARDLLRSAPRTLVTLAPVVFTAGWLWSGHRTPEVSHATRSISALSASGQPCPRPVTVGQLVQGTAQLVNAELARRAGLRGLGLTLAASGLGTLVTTGAPLPADEGRDGPARQGTARPVMDRAHAWSAGIGMVAFHLAPALGALDPRLPRRTRQAAVASLAVALPATAYFSHRLAAREGTGRVYGWAERTFLTVLLAWSTSLPAAYPSRPVSASTRGAGSTC